MHAIREKNVIKEKCTVTFSKALGAKHPNATENAKCFVTKVNNHGSNKSFIQENWNKLKFARDNPEWPTENVSS